MIHIARYGTTAENNSWTLPEGMLSQDMDKMSVRVHDGVTPGGFEAIGVLAAPHLFGPGGYSITSGDNTTGFYGEVTGNELITYSDLSSSVGLSAGTLRYNEESAWLKFSKDGQIIFVAKKVARESVDHAKAATLNILYDQEGTETISLGGVDYRITLMSDSEWGRFIYPVHVEDPSGIGWGVNYSNEDLDTAPGTPVSYMVDQPVTGRAIVRGGGSGVTYRDSWNDSSTNAGRGWRPVLRLLGETT